MVGQGLDPIFCVRWPPATLQTPLRVLGAFRVQRARRSGPGVLRPPRLHPNRWPPPIARPPTPPSRPTKSQTISRRSGTFQHHRNVKGFMMGTDNTNMPISPSGHVDPTTVALLADIELSIGPDSSLATSAVSAIRRFAAELLETIRTLSRTGARMHSSKRPATSRAVPRARPSTAVSSDSPRPSSVESTRPHPLTTAGWSKRSPPPFRRSTGRRRKPRPRTPYGPQNQPGHRSASLVAPAHGCQPPARNRTRPCGREVTNRG